MEFKKYATTAVSLKYLKYFWRSLKMPLRNAKYEVELKLKWTKYWVLSAVGADNVNSNDGDNDITFNIKDTKFMSLW